METLLKVEIMRDSEVSSCQITRKRLSATEILAKEGFVVMPYMYPDLNTARDLSERRCILRDATWLHRLDPTKDLATKEFIQILIDEIDLPIIVDAGIGKPSQACEAMEMGAAAIMANTALGNRR